MNTVLDISKEDIKGLLTDLQNLYNQLVELEENKIYTINISVKDGIIKVNEKVIISKKQADVNKKKIDALIGNKK